MKLALLIGAVAFLLIGFLLCFAAIVMFFTGRKGQGKAVATGGGKTAAPPPPPPPTAATDATVVVDLSRKNQWGVLEGIAGAVAGRTIPIPMNGVWIGRDNTLSQAVIDDERVSKRHVWVGVREGVVVAVDEGSTNGTFLNVLGTRITKVQLTPGDTLILSDDVARLVYRR